MQKIFALISNYRNLRWESVRLIFPPDGKLSEAIFLGLRSEEELMTIYKEILARNTKV